MLFRGWRGCKILMPASTRLGKEPSLQGWRARPSNTRRKGRCKNVPRGCSIERAGCSASLFRVVGDGLLSYEDELVG